MIFWEEYFLSAKSCMTVISSSVIVPVLSEQIIDTLPRVSALGIFLIKVLALCIFCIVIARPNVRTIGKPSGIALTARLMLVFRMSKRGIWKASPKGMRKAERRIAIIPIFFPRSLSFFWRGVSCVGVFSTKLAILPNSVVIPVFVVTATALPLAIVVPA